MAKGSTRKRIFYSAWDNGGMGGGGFFYITKRKSRYYFHSVDFGETYGPYQTLDEALSENEVFLYMINETTESIESSELSTEEIVSRIDVRNLHEDQVIYINNTNYIFSSEHGARVLKEGETGWY